MSTVTWIPKEELSHGCEAEVIKDNVWYGLIFEPDEGVYLWEQIDGRGDFISTEFFTVKAATDWMTSVGRIC